MCYVQGFYMRKAETVLLKICRRRARASCCVVCQGEGWNPGLSGVVSPLCSAMLWPPKWSSLQRLKPLSVALMIRSSQIQPVGDFPTFQRTHTWGRFPSRPTCLLRVQAPDPCTRPEEPESGGEALEFAFWDATEWWPRAGMSEGQLLCSLPRMPSLQPQI